MAGTELAREFLLIMGATGDGREEIEGRSEPAELTLHSEPRSIGLSRRRFVQGAVGSTVGAAMLWRTPSVNTVPVPASTAGSRAPTTTTTAATVPETSTTLPGPSTTLPETSTSQPVTTTSGETVTTLGGLVTTTTGGNGPPTTKGGGHVGGQASGPPGQIPGGRPGGNPKSPGGGKRGGGGGGSGVLGFTGVDTEKLVFIGVGAVVLGRFVRNLVRDSPDGLEYDPLERAPAFEGEAADAGAADDAIFPIAGDRDDDDEEPTEGGGSDDPDAPEDPDDGLDPWRRPGW